ncbi:TPR repeat-containing thioredoxin TTL1-like [Carex rostrata]
MFPNGRLPTWKETVEYGDHAFNKGKYEKALQEYDKALKTTPRNANLKISRAQTLVCLGRLTDALDEFGDAYKIDSTNDRLWYRMSLFHLRLGAIVLAEFFMRKASEASRLDLHVKIAKVKDRLVRAEKARKEDNWIAALREINAIIAEGVDYSQLIMAFRAEMLLRMDLVEEAMETLRRVPDLYMQLLPYVYFSGMPLLAYLWAVSAQIQLARGR